MSTLIKNVPTNIITGFLGTGKTTCIQHLLKFKPPEERWAVLVNEFGAIGVDATMYQNKHTEEGGVFVREVPGGCMCCVSGLPMQIALNVLLKLSNPHRLLIEPSGLGHPIEVVSLLMSEHYQDVLDIQKIITIIDPQHVLQNKFFEHETYQQQLEVADNWVFNKSDITTVEAWDAINNKIQSRKLKAVNVIKTEYGHIDPDVLIGKTGFNKNQTVRIQYSDSLDNQLPEQQQIPEDIGFIKESRFDEGFHGTSWRYNKNKVFNKMHLFDWIKSIDAIRIKGVFMTNEGVFGINVLDDQMQVTDFNDCTESKLEIISEKVSPEWDQAFAKCLVRAECSTS